jgi:hypothetical protein
MQAQSMEAYRVLRIVLSPPAIRNLLQHLEGMVVVLHVTFVYEEPSGPLWLAGANVRRFQNRP